MTEPKVIRLRPDGPMKAVLDGSVTMKHALLDKMSIAIFKVPKGKGSQIPEHFHRHAEEIGIQLKGTATVFACDKEYVVQEGEAILIPAGVEHTGVFSDDDECWLAIVRESNAPSSNRTAPMLCSWSSR